MASTTVWGRTVASVGAKTCKLVIDGKTTGNIPLDAVKVYNAATSVGAAGAAAAVDVSDSGSPASKAAPMATPALQEGERAVVSGGKYDGQQGVVASVTAKSCTLLIDGKKTGNIPLEAVSRVGAAGAVAAVDVSDSGSSDSGAKVRALAIGASQDPSAEAKQKAVAADVDFREVRYVPRNLAATREGFPLPDVIDDVVTVKKWMEDSGPDVEVNRFVGRDDTNSLTRKAFLAKVDRLLAQPGELFILYYAGHGTDQSERLAAPGAFCCKRMAT